MRYQVTTTLTPREALEQLYRLKRVAAEQS
jgi:hypothetical protein